MRRTSLLMIALLFALLPGATAAQEPGNGADGNFTLRINEDVTIAASERIDTLVVINADVEVEGTIENALVATSAAYMTERVGQSILTGLVVVIGVPILAVVLLVTLVGIAAGLGLLIFVLPALLFLGYIVAGTWLGTLILSRNEPKPTDGR